MSTEAEIMGIGPFNPEIANLLEYDVTWYDDVKPGTMVFSMPLFQAVTRRGAEALAYIFFAKMEDINTHQIKLTTPIKFDELKALWAEGLIQSEDIMKDIRNLKLLLAINFIMMYKLHV